MSVATSDDSGTWTQAPAQPEAGTALKRVSEPQCEWPMSEAMNHLRGDEILQVLRYFKARDVGDLGSIALMIGVIWAFKSRDPATACGFKDVAQMTVQEMTDYFAPEPVEPDDEVAQKSGGE